MITTDYDLSELYTFYKHYTTHKTKLVLLDDEEFYQKLIEEKIVFSSNNDHLDGFLTCCIEGKKAYISLICGEEKIVLDLLNSFEEYLVESKIFEIWIHFFNPVKLAWYPKANVVHPGIQGVVLNSELYNIYHKLGYKDHSIQQTYYQDITNFDMSKHKKKNCDFKIEFYNSKLHKGLIDFAKNIGVKAWHDEIIHNQSLDKPLPLLVALDGDNVIGFTGPIRAERNSRGYFAGIGIIENYRRMGIGNALFLRLCEELKNIGAKYMTFFTGTQNPARYIYLNAGFKVVETFVTMNKKLIRR
ncbi:MAG: GNAT family N-acetyltransferase [Tenericutes bacterium]|jgi:ribosomal protein S18 acetylase RimI-like enzyme|nr:GNAT family N-acetyltransferase [Mycoplasmatota bacterium]